MGSEFTFYDFVDDGGRNIVHDWMEQIPPKAKAKFNKWFLHLEGMPHGQWTRPMVDTLDGHCAGLFEVRVSLDRQYRILGAHNDRQEPTLLHGFIKPDDDVPEEDCDRAFVNKALAEAEPEKYRVEHRYE